MALEKAGELGEYYSKDTDEMGFKFKAERVHCTGRYTEELLPSAIGITDTSLTFTYPTVDDKTVPPETYNFTLNGEGKINNIACPDGKQITVTGG